MTDTITLTGIVGSDPRHHVTNQGLAITSFRFASRHRYFDRAKGAWEDGETNWYTVSAFRQLAVNTSLSVRKGERLVVRGRLRQREWNNGTKSGTSVEIEADSIGHDLAWGITTLTKVRREAAGDGEPSTVTSESNAWPGVEPQPAAGDEDGSPSTAGGLTDDLDADDDDVDAPREDRPRLEPVF